VIEVRGISNVTSWLGRVQRAITRDGRDAAQEAIEFLADWAGTYPPESRANRPRYGSWGPYYIRGTGSAYARKSGGTSIYGGSERLGESWESKVEPDAYGWKATTGPTASYGPYVHDRRVQSPFHKRRGWRTVQDGIVRNRQEIIEIFRRAIIRTIRRVR
jgi:hypothetical protein